MTTTGKYRDEQIQVEMYQRLNPSSTSADMLQRWSTNSYTNQDMAQFLLAIDMITRTWSERYRNRLIWVLDSLQDLNHNIDARSKQLAIEATKAIMPTQINTDEKKKGGLFGLFSK